MAYDIAKQAQDDEKRAQQQTAQTGNTGAAPAGYGDYLMKTYKPTTTVAGSYGQWLENRAKNMQIENTPQNAKSYADYLLSLGGDPVGNYNAQVKSANAQYDRARASYGQAAEKLAKAGLSGSGYGDYLEGLAYSQRAADISAAQQNAQNEMKQGFASYADYLENLKAQNEQSAINGILQGLLTGEDARTYAKNMNVANDRLDYILSQTEPQVQAQKQAQAQQEAANKDAAYNALSEMIGGGYTLDAAKQALAGGQYDAYLKDAVERYIGATNTQTLAAINASTVATNWKQTLDQQLAAGTIDNSTYRMGVSAGSKKNLEILKALKNGDTTGMMEYIDRLAKLDKVGKHKGEVKKSGIEQWNKLSDDVEKPKQILEWAGEMYAQGMLTEEDYHSLVAGDEKISLDSANDAERLAAVRESLDTRLENGEISQEQYNELLAEWKTKPNVAGDIAVSSFKMSKDKNANVKVTISYETADHGSESIELKGKINNSGIGFKKLATFTSNGKEIVVGLTGNGEPAAFIEGNYYEVSYSSTKHNKAFWASLKKA